MENISLFATLLKNYAFVVQDAAPGLHWNNSQVTVYTVVIYFRGGHISLVILSVNTSHDTISVYLYTQIIVDFIKSNDNNVKKITYLSDGAPQHFKIFKNIVNLYYHKIDFGIAAEWHFFATAHGKEPCDGIGGTMKRQAVRASLQRLSDNQTDNQITNAQELFEWAGQDSSLPNINVKFSALEFYNQNKLKIEQRFGSNKRTLNLKKCHYIIPHTDNKIIAKEVSSSLNKYTYRII